MLESTWLLKTYRSKIKLKPTQAFVEKFFPFIRNLKKSKRMLLDPILQIIKYITISEGSLSVGIFSPQEVMIVTIRESARSFALIHNHPSSAPIPSQKYFEVTDRFDQTEKIIGIHSVDHIIIE
jgi:DNA repair protein RadC